MERLTVSPGQCREAYERLVDSDRKALGEAAARIKSFHEAEIDESFETEDEHGNFLGVPSNGNTTCRCICTGRSGRLSVFSAYDGGFPRVIAGVREITVAVPAPMGECNRHVLAAMHVAEVDRIYTIGGAQAIAALAYGTETVKSVDKIVGPGGAFVAAAKTIGLWTCRH